MPKFGCGAEGVPTPSESTSIKITTFINYCVSVNSNVFTLSRGVPQTKASETGKPLKGDTSQTDRRLARGNFADNRMFVYYSL